MSYDPEEIEETLGKMSDPKDLVRQVQDAGAPKVDGEGKAPPLERERRFFIEHKTARGKVLKGWFTNRVLSVADHIAVGVMRSQLTGGVPYSSLDQVTRDFSEAVAHMSTSLKERPKWAENMAAIDDPHLIAKIFREVDAHEGEFRGQTQPAEEG